MHIFTPSHYKTWNTYIFLVEDEDKNQIAELKIILEMYQI